MSPTSSKRPSERLTAQPAAGESAERASARPMSTASAALSAVSYARTCMSPSQASALGRTSSVSETVVRWTATVKPQGLCGSISLEESVRLVHWMPA